MKTEMMKTSRVRTLGGVDQPLFNWVNAHEQAKLK
jgi:hypothetical protein